MNITLWIIAGLLAVVFLASAAMKLTQPKEKLAAFGFGWVDVLGELADAVPPARRGPVERRLERATDDLQRTFPNEARAT